MPIRSGGQTAGCQSGQNAIRKGRNRQTVRDSWLRMPISSILRRFRSGWQNDRMRRLFLTIIWFAALAGVGQISARPSWWAGGKPELIEAAKKSGKPIVVFFRDNSPESLRMENETLSALTPEQTGAFLWVYADRALVEGQSLAKFHHVEEFPTLLLRGPMGFELARVAGFVSPEKLLESLRQFPSEDEVARARIATSVDPNLTDPLQAERECKDCAFLFMKFDTNKDRVLTMREIPGYQKNLIQMQNKKRGVSFEAWFLEKDKNRDGVLQPLEFDLPDRRDRHRGPIGCGNGKI